MGKLRSIAKNSKNGILKFKTVVEKLQKCLFSTNYYVPKDVKEGHFVVIAEDECELKRFVIPLSYLTNPSFRRLLEQAAEVYGFGHNGALTVPCPPSELKWILTQKD